MLSLVALARNLSFSQLKWFIHKVVLLQGLYPKKPVD